MNALINKTFTTHMQPEENTYRTKAGCPCCRIHAVAESPIHASDNQKSEEPEIQEFAHCLFGYCLAIKCEFHYAAPHDLIRWH
jgi:hypothetical protein